jgi:transcriptional regulator with XRE-family HTH domain
MSKAMLSQVETGQRNISCDKLFAAAARYKVSLACLLGREDVPDSNERGLGGFFSRIRKRYFGREPKWGSQSA